MEAVRYKNHLNKRIAGIRIRRWWKFQKFYPFCNQTWVHMTKFPEREDFICLFFHIVRISTNQFFASYYIICYSSSVFSPFSWKLHIWNNRFLINLF